MEPINDSKKRKITFLRPKKGLIKKARELSTLCDVNVSMIICSDHQESPEIFPQDPVKLNDMINDYKTKRDSNPGKIKSYSLLPMDQLVFCTDERSMEALNTSLMKSEDVNDCYDGLKFDLKPKMMQQLEKPQNMDMQQVIFSSFKTVIVKILKPRRKWNTTQLGKSTRIAQSPNSSSTG
nr:transcription factor, MADS-box [Tanacetum cinerariifolium]